jgi:hypothetical protein
MVIRRFPSLFCDVDPCGQWANVDGDDARSLRMTARRIGWRRIDGKDYCPEHVPKEGK